ncbi:binding-protein-dependent transport systems inner membrane component [Allomeiothermus silvanus DSM 9946]|uniref:Binding-protein-dependent transport systems inner membrane component n=1 Tax=Allomeiothermus silvanus (strain ATCC 700542 / DSM 9946 / NBRC 106475 / NCIMB 13440 / VI-R2) TaxID=526227 RepID=D7BH13_ALLS1|nr:iron ABC transporter permease [Allomeiothermus silvanus]ADH63866.1 binding-protein-dependent transport systems inner membrane component [Allomeiothermus silvanus DSM 9946]
MTLTRSTGGLARGRSPAWIPGLVTLAGLLALPWARTDRSLLEFSTPLLVLNQAPTLGILLFTITSALALASFLNLPLVLRGYGLVGLGSLGFLGGVGWLVATSSPFGVGALLALSGLLVMVGIGLSESGIIQNDPFVTGSILVCSLFVLLFIVYPLFTVLRESVWIKGQFTLAKLQGVLGSPLFISIENPYTGRSERLIVLALTGVGALVGVWLLARAGFRWSRVMSRLVAGTVLGWIVGAGIFGAGALPTSLYLALIVAPVATGLGLVFALLEQRSRAAWVRRSLSVVSLLPLITPPFVFAFALTYWLGRRGIITYDLLGLNTNFLFGVTGVAIAQVLAFTPVAFLILRGSVQGLSATLEEASATLRASPWHTFYSVTWPLLRPGMAAAFLLTIIESLADFGNPMLLGGDRNFLATEVFLALTGRYDPNEAAVYGTVLLALVLTVFGLQKLWLGNTSFVTVTGKPGGGNFSPLPLWLERSLQGILLLWGLSVVLLYFSIFFGSFVDIWGIKNTFTAKHYAELTTLGLPVLFKTAQLALLSAFIATSVGFLIAYLVARQNFFGRGLLEVGSMLSFATPGTVMGVAYILAFNTGPWLLTGTGIIIVLALVFRNMPAAVRGVISGLSQIDKSLEEASTMLRAPSSTTLRRVLIPLLIPQLLAGAVFAFVRGMTAISQVIFLISPGNTLATVLMLRWIEQGDLGRGSAMATVMILSLLLVILLLFALSRRLGRASSMEGMV